MLCSRLSTYVKAAVRRFVSTEVHVKASVARRFFWTELCAWPEDLPAGSTILLSGKVSCHDLQICNCNCNCICIIRTKSSLHGLCAWPEDLPPGSTLLLSGKVGQGGIHRV
jgi:hypothetical protein